MLDDPFTDPVFFALLCVAAICALFAGPSEGPAEKRKKEWKASMNAMENERNLQKRRELRSLRKSRWASKEKCEQARLESGPSIKEGGSQSDSVAWKGALEDPSEVQAELPEGDSLPQKGRL